MWFYYVEFVSEGLILLVSDCCFNMIEWFVCFDEYFVVVFEFKGVEVDEQMVLVWYDQRDFGDDVVVFESGCVYFEECLLD